MDYLDRFISRKSKPRRIGANFDDDDVRLIYGRRRRVKETICHLDCNNLCE